MNVYKRTSALEEHTCVLAHKASIQGILQTINPLAPEFSFNFSTPFI